jgi:hypothetical protein
MCDEERLCLYLPSADEWMPTQLIAETIVPWTSLWLFYYETWHATGEWLGGGDHPKVGAAKAKRWKQKHQKHDHKNLGPELVSA